MRIPDPGVVDALLRQVAAEELLPRFGALSKDDIHRKETAWDPHDVVTAADHASERKLAEGLAALLPGAAVVGEEAVAANPRLREALSCPRPAWIVDPLDGTRNFVAGRETFGVIVALAEGGRTRAGWIHLPVEGVTFAAEEGGGAFELARGAAPRRLRPDLPATAPLCGTVYTRFVAPEVREAVDSHAPHAARLVDGTGSASTEYAFLLRGTKDFLFYGRLLPWDHAAGALILREAGGAVRHLDGREMAHDSRETGALAVRDARLWPEARRAVAPPDVTPQGVA